MGSREMSVVRIMNENERLKRLDEASRDGDINKLKQILEENPSLLDRFDHDAPQREAHDSPLHIAVPRGHVDFTIEVLQLKPQLAGIPNREGRLPLHLAAERGHLQIVEKLVDQQDDEEFHLCREKKYGYMPVHIAAINGKHAIVEMLIERCKDVLDKTTCRNETLLHLAVIANCLDSIHYLINQGVKLNEKDVDGNTCLHLACQYRNHQVITYLLDQEGIDVNSTNAWGLTPFDVLRGSLSYSASDVSLMSMLRRAGGKEATEQGNRVFWLSNSIHNFSNREKYKREKQNEPKTLLIVATLVATMTFPAILNAPGGSLSADKDKLVAGQPTLLPSLTIFFVLDSMEMFASISVILVLLCGIPKTKIVMKFLVAILWLAVLCAALAFAFAFYALCKITDDDDNDNAWIRGLFIAWGALFSAAELWALFRMIDFLLRIGGFKREPPTYWAVKVGWLRKATSIMLILCLVAFLCYFTHYLWRNFFLI